MTSFDEIKNGHIRPLNVSKDLYQVADLIELCFAGTIDDEGSDYIRYIRRMAEDAQSMYWGLGGVRRRYAPIQGFVYAINEKIVGNLSMLPFHKTGEFIYLIANVAVDPEYRRRGIARQLTARAIEYAHEKSAKSAWLQVRDDNPGAHNLYLQVGFVERYRRTTWSLLPKNALKIQKQVSDPKIRVRPTRLSDWQDHQDWLAEIYPESVRWNLGLRLDRLNPSLMARLNRWLNGFSITNLAIEDAKQVLGYATLEKTSVYSEILWLAGDAHNDAVILKAFFQNIQRKLIGKKPLSINLPFGRAEQTLEELGFIRNHTLIWMELSTLKTALSEN